MRFLIMPFLLVLPLVGQATIKKNPTSPTTKQAVEEATIAKFRSDAERGSAEAQFSLGFAYNYGMGVPRNYVEGVNWYRKAAEQGYVAAQFHLGICYHLGQGVAKDETASVMWCRMAAEQGHVVAQYSLGYNYENGLGVQQDWTEAMRWYLKAAERGHAMAQFNLGLCYAKGLGTPRDFAEAYVWFSLSAANGETEQSPQLRDGIANTLSPNDLSLAMLRAQKLQNEIQARKGKS